MKSIIQKGIIPARTQSQDRKFQTSRPCEVRRSGQVVVCAVFSLSFQAVVLLTKTAIHHRFFFQSSLRLRNFYFTTAWKFFSKIFIRSGKCIMWSSIQVLPNQVSKTSFYTFEDIDV